MRTPPRRGATARVERRSREQIVATVAADVPCDERLPGVVEGVLGRGVPVGGSAGSVPVGSMEPTTSPPMAVVSPFTLPAARAHASWRALAVGVGQKRAVPREFMLLDTDET